MYWKSDGSDEVTTARYSCLLARRQIDQLKTRDVNHAGPFRDPGGLLALSGGCPKSLLILMLMLILMRGRGDLGCHTPLPMPLDPPFTYGRLPALSLLAVLLLR